MDGDSAHSWNNEQYYNPDFIKRSTNYIEKVWVITVSENNNITVLEKGGEPKVLENDLLINSEI